MKSRLLILSLLLALASFPLKAQWSGSVDFSAGLGGMNGDEKTGIGYLGHILAQGNANLRYQTDKFTWTTAVNGRWEPKSSDNTRLNLNLAQQDKVDLELVYKTVKTRPLQIGVRSDFDWKPSGDRNYSAWITYQYRNDRARNVSNSLSGTLDLSEMDRQELNHFYESPSYLLDIFDRAAMESQQASCYYEIPKLDEHRMGTGARGEWHINSKNLLQGSFSISTTGSKKYTTWSVYKTDKAVPEDLDFIEAFEDGLARMYRITPQSIDLDYSLDIHMWRTVKDDAIRFRWAYGVRASGNHSLDYNRGATCEGVNPDGSYIWRDSLRLKEDFNFLALNAAPFVAAEYRNDNIEFSADYSVQFYLCRLNDDTRRQPLALQSVSPVGGSRFIWKITDVHRLGVTHDVGADYPDYLKICWYDRTGGYVDQLFRGNTDLVTTRHSRYGLTYDLKYRRFHYVTTNAITRRINEIDQTWFNEEIEGRLYKVFRWVNSADSWSFGTSHRFGWERKMLKAGLGVDYNQSRRTAKKGGAVKNSSDWRLTSDIEFLPGKGWSIGANARYQSKTATFFTSFNEYWELNAHIQKKFDKTTLFLELRDLLDNARMTSYESADGTQIWVDVARENRRLFLLGVQWNF